MDYVVGISWPRSGHHMMVNLLTKYFGPSFNYCIFYEKPGCCGNIPCSRPGKTHLSKCHDFELIVPQVEGQKYLIQYRQFTASVVSNFELAVRAGREDSEPSFQDHVSHAFDRYTAFVEKWVTSEFAQHQLVIEYDSFLQDPHATLSSIIQYIEPDLPIDPDRLAQAIATVDGERVINSKVINLPNTGVHAPRDVSYFRFYSPELFDKIDRLALSRDTVNDCFERLLGRKANDQNMLTLQAFPTVEDLENSIKTSKEYMNANP